MSKNAWNRANNRRFCAELVDILSKNSCSVYAVHFEKAAAKHPIDEDWVVPLSFQRLAEKFACELTAQRTIGTVVCDWSTHSLDRHVSNCVQSHVIAQNLRSIIGGVTYGSSQSLVPIQVCDLISGTFRISEEGGLHLAKLRQDLEALPNGVVDRRGFSPRSVSKLF